MSNSAGICIPTPEVVGLDNNEAALFHAASSTELEFRPVLADVRDSSALGKIFPRIDVVIHLAALTHSNSKKAYFKINEKGTEKLLAACQENKVTRFIYRCLRNEILC